MRHLILAIALAGPLSGAPALADNGSTQANAAAAKDPDQQIKCRKVEVTGSIIKKGRVCKTVAQWKNIISNGNENARSLVIDGTTRPAGN